MPLGARHRDILRLRVWLRDRDARAADGVFIVEGPRALRALTDRGRIPRTVYVDAALGDARRVGLAGTAVEASVVESGVLDRVADTRSSQGVIAVFDRDPPDTVRAAVSAASALVVLPRINDPGNLGTIARSAQAAGFGAIVVGPASVDPYNPKAVRAGAGAVGSLPIWVAAKEREVHEVLDEVAGRGGLRLGAASDGDLLLDDAPLTASPLALVLGHETAGLDALGLHTLGLDATVAIPMVAGAESLNVAMAATVLCFETARRRRTLA